MRGAIQQSFHGQFDTALLISLHDLDLNDLAFGQVVRDFFNTLMGNLADVQQAVFTRQQIHQRAEIQQLGDWAFVDFADFDFSRNLLNAALGDFSLFRICRGDRDGAIFVDVDLRTGFFGQRTNCLLYTSDAADE